MSDSWTLVTGATGFVGSRLVARLIERGERVKAFVRAGSNLKHLQGHPEDRFKLAVGDITVEHTVYRALSECDRLYHVASAFKMWDRDPQRIIGPAVDGTRATLTAARKRDLEKIVVTSSVAALGRTDKPQELDEEHEFNIKDPVPYVESKYRALEVTEDFAEQGMPIVSVLPSGIFGPGDWKPTPSGNGVLRYLKHKWWMGGFPYTTGGLNVVDVDDVVEGHIQAMEKGRFGERYILAGDNTTFKEMFDTLSDITGLPPPSSNISPGFAGFVGSMSELWAGWMGDEPLFTSKMARDHAFAFLHVTSAKAEEELGYQHRPMREALSRSVRWYLEKGYVPEEAARRTRLEFRPNA